MKQAHLPLVLVVLDGWGVREETQHNPIALARTPFFDELWQKAPHACLDASGVEVGLPKGQMGNSEIGHMVIGSGMVIPTDLVRIQEALERGEGDTNPVLQSLFAHTVEHRSALHLVGLIGPGGVHAHQGHLLGLIRAAKRAGVSRVFIHGFTDGRDTPPQSAAAFVCELEAELKQIGLGQISTLCGRFFAMDRDTNWERIEAAERALFEHSGQTSLQAPSETLATLYAANHSDEQLAPLVFPGGEGETCSPIQNGDAVFFFNFRADRAVQLSRRILERIKDQDIAFATMTIYADDLACPVAFPSFVPPVTLAEELSKAGLTQAHIAETEKYAHATYFLNGGRSEPFPGEVHVMIESQKVRTHDLAPEMRAKEITDAALLQLEAGKDFLFLNYANADMVGHTAHEQAIITAIEVVDRELARLAAGVAARGGVLFITADHGNAEQNFDHTSQQMHTAHTTNLVPAILTDSSVTLRPRGTLADIAPTLLELLNLPVPAEMTGRSLLLPNEKKM
jgi:2,3-bisphosphoglycerate-independent phosphoglycerate mutase